MIKELANQDPIADVSAVAMTCVLPLLGQRDGSMEESISVDLGIQPWWSTPMSHRPSIHVWDLGSLVSYFFLGNMIAPAAVVMQEVACFW